MHAEMQKTGETQKECCSAPLWGLWDQIDAQLTEEQRKKLAELKQYRQRHAANKERPAMRAPVMEIVQEVTQARLASIIFSIKSAGLG